LLSGVPPEDVMGKGRVWHRRSPTSSRLEIYSNSRKLIDRFLDEPIRAAS
jgi:hypothetical protein